MGDNRHDESTRRSELMNGRSSFPLKRVGGCSALAGTAVLGLAVLTSQGVVARGNPSFEGIISAAQPTGFMSSPDAYNIPAGRSPAVFTVRTRTSLPLARRAR